MMVNKQSFKLFLGMLAMLIGLTGCGWSTEKQEVEELQTGIEKLKVETSGPATYLIVGFAGLTDPGTHPADWLGKIEKMIGDKTATSTSKPQVYQLLIKRSDENKTVEQHAKEAQRAIVDYLIDEKKLEDLSNVKLILVAESYGGLVAAQLALKSNFSDLGISIAGLITVRTPWEGVSLVQGIPKLIQAIPQQLSLVIKMLPQVAGFVDRPKALETLNPNGGFIQDLKSNGLPRLDFPILALAGQDKQPTSPYMELKNLEGTLTPMLPFLQLMVDKEIVDTFMKTIKEDVLPLLKPYELGNDGLVLTSSAIAATSNKSTNFKSHVLSDFPHLGNTTNHTVALGYVKSFIGKIVK